ncbi:hypothetical protein RIF25_10375 [Thermosynechococcaceae cyanobacterium BACA0444]|uniref:Uncharacterized protein n=1 Tax=Pseudocalidococcus azoricus BACA0444 TaxID=2918990 RepID=A0AAE4FSB7_9CYAN|nr:hypothetical protein [Pseudocalidococcus azoricus]MDS3861211.1 hypothetical protein [Pseudocalidococcus azoricus BACA0444]
MEHASINVSTCRFCSHYDPQGRRGGECRQLGVPVKGYWRACPLAMAAFTADGPKPFPVSILPQARISTLPEPK